MGPLCVLLGSACLELPMAFLFRLVLILLGSIFVAEPTVNYTIEESRRASKSFKTGVINDVEIRDHTSYVLCPINFRRRDQPWQLWRV